MLRVASHLPQHSSANAVSDACYDPGDRLTRFQPERSRLRLGFRATSARGATVDVGSLERPLSGPASALTCCPSRSGSLTDRSHTHTIHIVVTLRSRVVVGDVIVYSVFSPLLLLLVVASASRFRECARRRRPCATGQPGCSIFFLISPSSSPQPPSQHYLSLHRLVPFFLPNAY